MSDKIFKDRHLLLVKMLIVDFYKQSLAITKQVRILKCLEVAYSYREVVFIEISQSQKRLETAVASQRNSFYSRG